MPERRGETFRKFMRRLERLGYARDDASHPELGGGPPRRPASRRPDGARGHHAGGPGGGHVTGDPAGRPTPNPAPTPPAADADATRAWIHQLLPAVRDDEIDASAPPQPAAGLPRNDRPSGAGDSA